MTEVKSERANMPLRELREVMVKNVFNLESLKFRTWKMNAVDGSHTLCKMSTSPHLDINSKSDTGGGYRCGRGMPGEFGNLKGVSSISARTE